MASSLFGIRTVQKQSSRVSLSARQRSAADTWLTMLEGGQMVGERENYLKFADIVLRSILGYDITRDVNFEKGAEFTVPSKNGGGGVCFECKPHGTDLFAPQHRSKGEHSTPLKQTWDYMGNGGLEFGVCTNFQEFVLLVTRPGYGYTRHHLFDFAVLADDPDRLKEFVWCFGADALGGPERVDGLADGTASEEHEITDEFYALFAEARLELADQFEGRGLARRDAVLWAQKFLIRLAFIFFAADRRLVGELSFGERMRAAAATPTMRSTKACAEVLDLFEAFDAGDGTLGVHAFNGGLFADKPPPQAKFPDILPDGQKNPVIDALIRMEGYDFDKVVGVHILGRIFEQSVSDIEGMLGDRPAARKAEGIYYTPEYVTDYLCRRAILPALSAPGRCDTDVAAVLDGWGPDLRGLEKRLHGLRVWDPACGSGAFLAKAVDVLLEVHYELHLRMEWAGEYDVKGNWQLDVWNAEAKAEQIIQDSIYGTDINPEAVETAMLSLFLRVADGGRKLPNLSRNVVDTDSVRGFDIRAVFPHVECFDAVVGNPPYVRQEMLHGKRAMRLADGWLSDVSVPSKSDYSVYFWLRGLNHLKEGGILGFISSDSWLSYGYGAVLRRVLSDRCDVLSLARPAFGVFRDAAVRTVLGLVRRGAPAGDVALADVAKPRDLPGGGGHNMRQKDLGHGNWNVHFEYVPPSPRVPMAKLAETGKVARGKTTGRNAFFVLTGAMVEEHGISDAFLAPVVAGGTAEGLLRDDDATEWFLDIKEPKATLARSKEGRRALRYVEIGERTMVTPKRGRDTKPRPISRLSSVSGRRLWYNLGLGKPPAAFLSIFADGRAAFYENGGRFFARNNFAYYTPSEARHLRPVLAWMACSWFGLYQERYGHRAGGGALQFLTGDYKAAPVPDFSVMDGADLDRWAAAWREYDRDMDRDRLDCTVLRLAGLTDSEADGVRDALRRMTDARRSKRNV